MSIVNINEFEKEIKSVCDQLKSDLNLILVHRAFTESFEKLNVNGGNLRSVASVGTANNTTITVRPFEKSNLKSVEDAVRKVAGYTTNVKGEVIYLELMPLYKDVIEKKTKEANLAKENTLIKIRQIRQEALNSIKKNKTGVSENIIKKSEKDIQKVVDDATSLIKSLSTNVA
jgi:ribosome recycling factor